MYDLCTRPEPPQEQQQQQQQQVPPPAEGEPEGRGDAVKTPTASGPLDGEKTGEQGADSSQDDAAAPTKFPTASSVLGKRQHSLCEGVNGCEDAAYGKVGVMHSLVHFHADMGMNVMEGSMHHVQYDKDKEIQAG